MKEFKQALERLGHEGADGDDEPLRRPGVPGRRVHEQRRARARYALQKTMRAMDLGKEFGAETYVFWGGREGTETNAGKDRAGSDEVVPRRAQLPVRVRRSRRATTTSSRSSRSPTSRAATSSCRPSATCSRFIYTLDHPEMVGLNPESRARHDGGSRLHARRRAGDRGGEAVPHRSQRAEARPIRPGPSLRQRGPQGRVLPRQAARGHEVGGHAALRQPRVSHGRPAGRVGLRGGEHAHVSHPQGEGRQFNADTEIQALLAELRARGARSGHASQVQSGGREGDRRRARSTSTRCARRATRTSDSTS